MEIFSALLALCVGNSPVTGEFPSQRPVTRSFDIVFICALNKQSWGWWFETLSRSLWRHRNEFPSSSLIDHRHDTPGKVSMPWRYHVSKYVLPRVHTAISPSQELSWHVSSCSSSEPSQPTYAFSPSRRTQPCSGASGSEQPSTARFSLG